MKLQTSGLFIDLCKKQSELFHKNNQVFIDCLVKFNSVRHTLTAAYESLVGYKKITPVEDIPLSDWDNLLSMTKYYADGRMDGKGLNELSKALYTLEYYLQ